MKILKNIIYSLLLIFLGIIIGFILEPVQIYEVGGTHGLRTDVKYDPETQLSHTTIAYVMSDGSTTNVSMVSDAGNRCELDDLLFLQHRINELDLKWTYIKIQPDGSASIEFLVFLPWELKQSEAKGNIASNLILEMENRKDSTNGVSPLMVSVLLFSCFC